MKLADKIAESMKNVDEKSANSLGAMDKKAMGVVEKLMKESYKKNNESQGKMCEMMKSLAEMDSKVANEFMGYMDEMASKYEMKGMDEADSALKLSDKRKKEIDKDDEINDEELEDEDDKEDDDKEDDVEEKSYKKKKEAKK